MKKLLFIAFVGIFSCFSCKKEKNKIDVQTNAKFASELRLSATQVEIENRTFILTTYLTRDFMPSPDTNDANGRGLSSSNKLTIIDNSAIPATIKLKKQYVINGDEIWTADYDQIKNDPNRILEGIVRNGPKWGPDVLVDVVCEFEHNGKTFRLLAKSQVIGAVY